MLLSTLSIVETFGLTSEVAVVLHECFSRVEKLQLVVSDAARSVFLMEGIVC